MHFGFIVANQNKKTRIRPQFLTAYGLFRLHITRKPGKKTIPRKEKISYLLKFGIIDYKALEKEKVINDLKHQFQLMW